MGTDSDNWEVWSKHVLEELKRLSISIDKLTEQSNANALCRENTCPKSNDLARIEAAVAQNIKALAKANTTAAKHFGAFGVIYTLLLAGGGLLLKTFAGGG